MQSPTAQDNKPAQALSPGASQFVTTKWTRVLEARGDSPEAKAALSDLCAAYYAPVSAFIRRSVSDEEAARDLTQEFFARLLSARGFSAVDPQRGRFRSYLLGAVKHFLAEAHQRERRLKRGGGQPVESVDAGTDTSPGLQLPDAKTPSPDLEFDRKWALTLIDRALDALAAEHLAAGRAEHFQALKPWLTGDTESLSQAEAARRLGLSEGAVKVAVHRLRRRFRELLKAEILRTVNSRTEAEEELCDLQAILAH